MTFTQPLTGLDSVKVIRDYFTQRKIDLGEFQPDYVLVKGPEVAESVRAPKLMRREQQEFLIYHPHAAAVPTKTPGERNVYLVTYGDADGRRGTANYNSAVGGKNPFSYSRKDGTQKPVVFLLGPVHGLEMEEIAGLLNLTEIPETGRDRRGRGWGELAANLAKCRVLIVPCGSPDGPERCSHGCPANGPPHRRRGHKGWDRSHQSALYRENQCSAACL